MNFNFVEYIDNINLYAIIDGVILLTICAILSGFFIYKKNIKGLFIVLSVFILDILVMILSELSDVEILTISRYILHYACLFAVFTTIVVYKNDLKSIFQKMAHSKNRALGFGGAMTTDDELRDATTEILTSCQNMAKSDTGAIIIIDSKGSVPESIIETGTILNAILSAPLIESIFNTKSPLHDGAVIVRGNKIIAAGCFLTLTQRNVNKDLGTRHRAAIGITEESNVLSIVVSEETGIVSVVKNGEIRRYMTIDKLKDEVEESFDISPLALARRQAKKDKKNK